MSGSFTGVTASSLRAISSTACWSSGVASAPRSSEAMASRSSSLRVLASLPLLKNAGKNEILALHLWEGVGRVVVGLEGKLKEVGGE